MTTHIPKHRKKKAESEQEARVTNDFDTSQSIKTQFCTNLLYQYVEIRKSRADISNKRNLKILRTVS